MGPTVRLEAPHLRARTYARSRGAKKGTNLKAKRVSSWIVRGVILATTGFALVDLALLISGLH